MIYEQYPDTFSFPVRVYYEDTDAGGVVYYANYLKFLERCRSECLRSVGIDQADLLRDPGLAFVVRSLKLDYLKPARLDDELEIGLRIERFSRAQIFFQQQIWRRRSADGTARELLLAGQVQIVCVQVPSMKVASIPDFLRTQLEAFQ